MGKIGLRIFSLTIFLSYVLIPLLINFLNLQDLIYYNHVSSDLIISNLLCALIPFVWSFNLKINYPKINFVRKGDHIFLIFIISVLLFTVLNDFRFTKSIIISRSFDLLYPLLVVSAVLYSFNHTKRKIILIIIFSVIFIHTDSRGLLLFSVGSLILSHYVDRPLKINFYSVLFLFIFLIVFTFWGLYREDGQYTSLFSFIFRVSEPYWYFASENSSSISVYDILKRISWAVTRVNFFNVEGNIDGNIYYIDKILSMDRPENVSLPITLIGQGFLLKGKLGTYILVFLVTFLLSKTYSALSNFGHLGILYSVYLTMKVVNLHAKSISGAISYLIYETVRDLLIIFVVWKFSSFIFKNYVHRRVDKYYKP